MSGVERKAFFDASERRFTFGTFQDVEPIVEDNKRLQTETQTSDFMRHVGRVPLNLINQWINDEHERGNPMRLWSPECDLMIYAKLQDPEYAYLRTTSSHVSGWLGFGS